MDQVKFSIVISAYNKISDLRRCLLALREQLENRTDSEAIIINDGGQPEVEEIVKSSLSGIKTQYLFLEHAGPAKARNLGIKNSQGEIIIFLDADAVPEKNWLNAFAQAWKRGQQTEGIGGYIAIDPRDSIICKASSCYCNWFLEQNWNGKEATFLLMGNASYKKEALLNINGFDESFKKAAGEDRDLNIRLLQNGYKLKIEKNIKVYHDRAVTFRDFLQRHYLQGKMSYKLYDKHPNLKKLPVKAYLSFCNDLRQNCRGFFEMASGCILFIIAQALTACGYFFTAFVGFFSRKGSQMPITPRLDINLGYICNNNCLFCYFLGRKKECINIDEKKAKDIMSRAKKSGIKIFEITGGEPALRKDIVKLVAFASGELGIKDITVITNGSRFSDENFVAEMKNAGMNDVLISIHGPNAEIHDALTQNKGSFENAIKAIKNITSQGISCRSNTVITSLNYKQVPDIAGLMHGLAVKQLNLIFFAPLDDARAMQKQLWVKYSDAASYLRATIDRYKDDFKNISVKALPFCILEGYDKYLTYYYQNSYDPYEWDYYVRVGIKRNKMLRDLAAFGGIFLFMDFLHCLRIGLHKSLREGIYTVEGFRHCVKSAVCRKCKFDLICPGAWKIYEKNFGLSEIRAIEGRKIECVDYPLWSRYVKDAVCPGG